MIERAIDRFFSYIDPRIVLSVLAGFYVFLLVLQHTLGYFPPGFNCYRIPGGRFFSPYSYSLVEEYITRQGGKPYVLLGDSIPYGYGVSAKQSVGYQLAEQDRFVNLSTPGLAFPTQALLLQALIERHPEKRFVVQINPKWFVSSWIPESFGPFKSDLAVILKRPSLAADSYLLEETSRSFWVRRALSYISLNTLRDKIRYRWFNQRIADWIAAPPLAPGDHKRMPFVEEEILSQEKTENAAKEPMSEHQKEELLGVADPKGQELISQAPYQSLLEMIARARPHVAVVLVSNDPDSVRQLSPALQANYWAFLDRCVAELRARQVPLTYLRLPGEDYSDYNHLSSSGHQKVRKAIESLCVRLS
jgi:hypothetical protein